ncbi:MAG: DUF1801 domain-containing protein [Solirubrobacteraceae bacterium]|nr:DUF1801 domain-containing protein [Solirubrobacteraceae bacterium]
MSGASDVDAYLAGLDPAVRAALEALRAIIREEAPDATEAISYGMPAFKLHGSLVGYAAFQRHCSFFPMSSSAIDAHAAELQDFKTSKGTIQFVLDHPIPEDIVRAIVRARVAENLSR